MLARTVLSSVTQLTADRAKEAAWTDLFEAETMVSELPVNSDVGRAKIRSTMRPEYSVSMLLPDREIVTVVARCPFLTLLGRHLFSLT